MKKNYILINSERLKVSNWIKWLLLIFSCYFCLFVIAIVESLVSKSMNINIYKILLGTCYIRAFIILSFIYDLAPRFKKSISVIWSILISYLYLGFGRRSGDRLYLITLLFIFVIVVFNILLNKKTSKFKTTEKAV